MKRPRRLRPGFTLIEVLVALALIAVALAAGTRAAGSLIGNAERLADFTAAQWCADNHLTNLKLTRLFPDVGETSVECLQLGQPYRVTVKVQGLFNPNFRMVDASVSKPDGTPLVRLTAIAPRF